MDGQRCPPLSKHPRLPWELQKVRFREGHPLKLMKYTKPAMQQPSEQHTYWFSSAWRLRDSVCLIRLRCQSATPSVSCPLVTPRLVSVALPKPYDHNTSMWFQKFTGIRLMQHKFHSKVRVNFQDVAKYSIHDHGAPMAIIHLSFDFRKGFPFKMASLL